MKKAVTAVNRDAGQQQKGFRLQKLRAVEFIFDSLDKNQQALVYSAIETHEDVNHVASDEKGTQNHLEQNKAYDPDTGFSFQNSQVLKAVCNFIACWAAKDFSSRVFFGYYCTNQVSKERTSDRTTRLKLTLPDKPIIELLTAKEHSYTNLFECVVPLVLDYAKETKAWSQALQNTIAGWDTHNWKDFFSQVVWRFGQQDVQALQTSLTARVKSSPFYQNRSVHGREEFILSRIMDLLDERQSFQNPTERFVYGAEVKNFFLEVSSGEAKLDDPTWQLWKGLNASDKRGLAEKIQAVCSSFSEKQIKTLSRKAAAGMLLNQGADRNKKILSARYRIYDCCKELLDKFIAQNAGAQISGSALDAQVDGLVVAAETRLKELSKDFDYPISNRETVKEVMLELVDSCYLAFDENDKEGGNG